MRSGFACLCALACGVLTSWSQTNSCGTLTPLFEVSDLQLRSLLPWPDKSQVQVRVISTNAPSVDLPQSADLNMVRTPADSGPGLKLTSSPSESGSLNLSPQPALDFQHEQMAAYLGSGMADFYGPLRPDHFYLIEPEPRSESGFVRAVENVFEPAPIRLGKRTTLSCSVITAIKRKNPLCLLNPFFFQLSW